MQVLAKTLRSYTDATLIAVQIDDPPVSELRDGEIVSARELIGEDLGISAAIHARCALQCALLGPLMLRLIEWQTDALLYLSPGLRVTASLEAFFNALGSSEVALVPKHHCLNANCTWYGHAGTYTQKVIGFGSGPMARKLLAAWPRRFLARDGSDACRACASWIDSIPVRLPATAILSGQALIVDGSALAGVDPACALRGGALFIGDQQVPLVDLADINPDDIPALQSTSAFTPAGIVDAGLLEFLRLHATDLRAAGIDQAQREPQSYDRLADGLRLTQTIRTLVVEAVRERRLKYSPFEERGRRELYEYLLEPATSGSSAGLTRLHAAIWQRRDDLRAAYPHLEGPDGPGFAGWLCAYGCEQEGLTPELLPPIPDQAYRDADPNIQLQPQRFGANVVGFFNSELGIGEMARLLAAGFDETKIPFLPIQGRLRPPSRAREPFQTLAVDEAVFPLNVICINGDGVPVFAREAGRKFFSDRYNIAMWWWEVGPPPSSWDRAYEFIDEIWVGSRYVYDLIAPTAPVPVIRMPVPLADLRCADCTRSDLGLPERGFIFVCIYDYHSVVKRKNPSAVISAFRRAFESDCGVHLVLKSVNGELRPREHARVLMEAGDHPSIHVIDGYLSAPQKNSLLAACDCYVSLHRAEGFGLTMAEAMLLEKPVIATRFGGNVDFMNDTNSYLVNYTSTPVGEDAYPYAPDAEWAEPCVEHAAMLMRRIVERPEEARRKGAKAKSDLYRSNAPANAGAAMKARLERIHERHATAASLAPAYLSRLDVPSTRRRSDDETTATRRLGDFLKGRLVRGLLRHRTNEEALAGLREEAAELRCALEESDRRMRDVARGLGEQSGARHAEVLAELRSMQRSWRAGPSDTSGAGDGDGISEQHVDRRLK